MRIYKYPILDRGLTTIEMPMGAQILSVGLDLTKRICLWALVDPDNSQLKEVQIETVWTGEEPTVCNRFLGTVTASLVYHIFTI